MAKPHPVLLALVAKRPLPRLGSDDGEALVTSAMEHRIQGLLWDAVRGGEVVLPSDLVHRLARHDLRIRADNTRLWHALDAVNSRLGDIGVEVLAAKGITAEARWYDRLGQRPCSDIDLVLDPAAVPRIRDVVAALEPGHRMLDDLPQLVGTGVLQSVDVTFEGAEIDLHSDLLKFELPTRQAGLLWSRGAEVSGPDGIVARAVDAEISLIHFLLHLNKDRFARLLGYSDVARILRDEALDWHFIDRFLAGEGLRTPAYCALDAVTDELGLPRAPHPAPRALSSTVWQVLWRPDKRMLGHVGEVSQTHRQLWLPWLARGRTAETLWWWLRRRVFPPAALLPVYHPDTSGSYLQRLVVGRVRRTSERRRIERGVAIDPRFALLAGERYKTFPPKWAHIKVPTSSTGAALAALALYAPCQPAGYAVRDAAWMAVRSIGPAALPSRGRPWHPPLPREQWRALLARWRAEAGPVDSLAVLARPQAGRAGFSLLLIAGDRGRAFVRIQKAGRGFALQEAALTACDHADVTSFWHPSVVSSGTLDEWAYLATTALAPQRHLPAEPPQDVVLEEMEAALRELPRAAGVPDHWTPMHGDFTQWNCRRLDDGRTAVFDWEDVGWGPPGADSVLFRATAVALGRELTTAPAPIEAVRFWTARLEARTPDHADEQMTRETLRALHQMAQRAPDAA